MKARSGHSYMAVLLRSGNCLVMVQSLSFHGLMPYRHRPVRCQLQHIVQNVDIPMANVMTRGDDLISASV